MANVNENSQPDGTSQVSGNTQTDEDGTQTQESLRKARSRLRFWRNEDREKRYVDDTECIFTSVLFDLFKGTHVIVLVPYVDGSSAIQTFGLLIELAFLTFDWWFASTGIPLLAATLGPLANVSSIAALVTSWRMDVYINGQFVPQPDGIPFPDPRWCYYCNVASLICGFLGNIFLLFNFTQRIRYIIALPATIILWYIATGFLIGITVSMEIYAPPNRPLQVYTQGFWYAVAAAAFYLICSMLLMVNMLGYFLGHYPDNFALTDSQRTLILQTMVFFIWLAGGAAVFMKIETGQGWGYADSLYFCDVTILTVGFGDFYPTTSLGRGIVFPFSVGGIITLALIVSSIYKFMRELGEENIVMKHRDRMRQRTASRTVTNSFDLRQREHAEHHLIRKRSTAARNRLTISAPTQPRIMRTAMGNTVKRVTTFAPLPDALRQTKKTQLLLLKKEKDRFNAMREIQHRSKKYRQWVALMFSTFAFGILWCVGAVVFWRAERRTQDMTYFQALYFCYVSLLTIGYGDLAPKSNAGRCFFVVWSLIAVPTMTILVSDLGDTVVEKFRRWSDELADFTVLPKHGIWRSFLDNHPSVLKLVNRMQKWLEDRNARKRVEKGFQLDDPDRPVGEEHTQAAPIGDVEAQSPSDDRTDRSGAPMLPPLAAQADQDFQDKAPPIKVIAHDIALAIKRVAADMHLPKPKRYTFEEWIEFVRLIRLSSNRKGPRGDENQEDDEGLVDWDWIGEDSPLMSGLVESEWLLNRLCESLIRLSKKAHIPEGETEIARSGTRESIETVHDEKGAGQADAEGKVIVRGTDDKAV